MIGPIGVKAATATGCLVAACTWLALVGIPGDPPAGGLQGNNPQRSDALVLSPIAANDPLLAQLGPRVQRSRSDAPPTQTPGPSRSPASGGGEVGIVSADGAGEGETLEAGAMGPALDRSAIAWQRPSEQPSWLISGQSIERNRQVLDEEFVGEFQQTPLSDALAHLTDGTGATFELNSRTLDAMGIAPDSPVSLLTGSRATSVREVLRRILSPLDLGYVVTESTIEITTRDDANERVNLRFYDLAHILPNSENVGPLVTAIQQQIDPGEWSVVGGVANVSVVGSMMIVSCNDAMHQRIETLLLNISRMDPANVTRAIPMEPSMSGMGGGMGGMGGMGGGFF